MKRLLVFLLLITLILTGCAQPAESNVQVFNQYGFSIDVGGTAQLASGSDQSRFSLYTSVGTLEFTYDDTDAVPVTEKNVVDFANNLDKNSVMEQPVVEQLENGAFLVTLPAKSAGNNQNVIESYYITTVDTVDANGTVNGTACWRVYAVTIEKTYNKDALVSAMLSLCFAKRESK